jgi:hypothetical protein
MKHILLSAVVGSSLMALGPISQAAFPPYNNSVAVWLMDEGAGTKFYDATTNNNTGTFNFPSWTFNTVIKQYGLSSASRCASCGFSNDAGVVPDSASLHLLTNNFSVEGWWRLMPGGNFPTLISREDLGRNATAWAMGLTSANTVGAFVYDQVSGTFLSATDPTPFPTNQFAHMAFTFASGALSLYRNGTLVASASNAGIHPFGVGRLLIGDFAHGNGPNTGDAFPWVGQVDEVRLSDIVRVPGDGSGTGNFLAWNASLVPEPTSILLWSAGAVLLRLRRCRGR